MDSSQLADAYQRLLHAARFMADQHPKNMRDREFAGWVLSQVSLYDQSLVRAARHIVRGAGAVVDVTAAMNERRIRCLHLSRTLPQLVSLVAHNATELLVLIERIPPEQADTFVRARLSTRAGHVVFDDLLCWRDILELRAEQQLPLHTNYIARLAADVGEF